MDHNTAESFLRQARHSLARFHLPRIARCLRLLSDREVWWRPNAASNSAGNLVLHLIGNVRQWIISGIGGAPDSRKRSAEFSTRQGASGAELISELEGVFVEADTVLSAVASDALLERRMIQGRDVTVF